MRFSMCPSTRAKLEYRGFNHLKGIYERLGFKEVLGLRAKEELIQEKRNRNERKRMIDNFIYEGERKKKVLIVDDVLTTGSSVLGVYKAIKESCDEIKIVVLSRK